MALKAHLLFSFTSPVLHLRLCCPLKSSSKAFLRSQSQSPTPRRNPLVHHSYHPHPRFMDPVEQDEEEEEGEAEWVPPARYGGAFEEDGDGDGDLEGGGVRWGPPVNSDAEEKGGERDPPVSAFRGQEQHQPEEEEDDEEEEGCEWWEPGFFLRSQEEKSRTNSTTAMEEVLAFARSHARDNQAWEGFLAGYNPRVLSEEDCIELLRRMGEEGLALRCYHLFRWMRAREEPPVPLSPSAWTVVLAVLGRAGMADEVVEIFRSLPPERVFREAILYNAAISGLACCGR